MKFSGAEAVKLFTRSHSVSPLLCLRPVRQPMETAEGDVQFRPRTGKAASAPLLPEVEAYLQLLMVVHLTNNKRYTEVSPRSALGRWSPAGVPCFSVCVCVCCRLRRCLMTCCRRSAQRTAELWIWWLPSVTTTTPEFTSSSTSLTPYAGMHTCGHARTHVSCSGVNEPCRSQLLSSVQVFELL